MLWAVINNSISNTIDWSTCKCLIVEKHTHTYIYIFLYAKKYFTVYKAIYTILLQFLVLKKVLFNYACIRVCLEK